MSTFISKLADAITPALVAFPLALMLSTVAHAAAGL
jgi:hypothetical protein